jgi:hypothetical protein
MTVIDTGMVALLTLIIYCSSTKLNMKKNWPSDILAAKSSQAYKES